MEQNNIQQQTAQQYQLQGQQQIQQQLQQQHKSTKRYFAVIILLILVLGLTVGYSILSTSFSINGTSTIKSSTWNISIEDNNIECPAGAICTIAPTDPDSLVPDEAGPNGAIIWLDGNTVYFKHVLASPGDVFTFNAKFTNSGSINAKVSSVTTSSLNATAQRFMTYNVTYADGTQVRAGDTLAAGASATFKVTVAYRNDISALPTAEELALINETSDGHTGATSLFTVTYEQD